MATSRKVLREELKLQYLTDLIKYFTDIGEDVLRIKSNEIALPVVDKEGNEDFIKIVVSIPTGANKGTEPFDAYELAQEYEMKLEQKARQKKEMEEKKKRKSKKIKCVEKKKNLFTKRTHNVFFSLYKLRRLTSKYFY